MYAYNFLGLSSSKVAATEALPEGKVTIRYEFAYDGGGLGKGGTGTIFVNGEKVAEGQIDRTQANHLLGRRRRGRRPGRRDAGDGRLQGRRQQVHRQDRQGDRRSNADQTRRCRDGTAGAGQARPKGRGVIEGIPIRSRSCRGGYVSPENHNVCERAADVIRVCRPLNSERAHM